MELPRAIETYFAGERSAEAGAFTNGFAPNATVRDEGETHVGHEAILAWRLAARTKYADLVTEPVEQITDGDRITVRCKVSGDFPGSPVLLAFAFTLADGQIAGLEIH